MEDERIEERALLDLEDASQRGRVESVTGEAIDRFGRQTDHLAPAQELDGARNRLQGRRDDVIGLRGAGRVGFHTSGYMEQFESFKASRLYCRKCAKSMSVRERLLLIQPDKDLYEYLCTGCGSSLGEREVSLAEKHEMALRALRTKRRRH